MTYKGSSIGAIARELKVDALVEGSVLRSGWPVRIVAQLIDASTDAHLWAHTYERDFEDVLRLEAGLAEGIGRQIKPGLRPKMQPVWRTDPASNRVRRWRC